MAGNGSYELTGLPQFRDFAAHLEGIAVWAGDESGYDYMSPGFEDIWGIPVEAAMDDIWRVIEGVHPDDRERVTRELEESVDKLNEGERYETEHRVLRPDGEVRWVHTRVFPIHDESGELIETVGMAVDITERKQVERALERQNERLERFAETVSHDLRNPLATAMGYVDLLEEAVDHEAVDRIDRSLRRMDGMIDQILTLARTGQNSVETEPLDLVELVAKSWGNVDGEAGDLTIEGDLATIAGDQELTRRLFENLFRNAIEHGGPDVTVTVGPLEGQAGLFVEDDGPGIPDEARETLFNPESRSGGGLGLIIVREICDLHDWSIDVVSASGTRIEISGFD